MIATYMKSALFQLHRAYFTSVWECHIKRLDKYRN